MRPPLTRLGQRTWRCLVLPFASVMVAQEPSQNEPAPAPPEHVVAILAGTVHPVAGPAIQNGVVLIRGERIAAVGTREQVTIPADAEQLNFPAAHVYPGLIDALTDAYTDTQQRADQGLDAGAALVDGLRVRGDRDDELLAAGITTAFVGSRAPSIWRGIGVIVRPRRDGFELQKDRSSAALQLRMSTGPGPTHALQRQQALDATQKSFDELEAYKKTFTDHQKALEKYGKDFTEYLAFHKKKSGDKGKPAEGEARPTEGARPEGRQGGGRQGRGPGPQGERPPAPGPAPAPTPGPQEQGQQGPPAGNQQQPAPATSAPKPAGEGDKKPEEKAPPRPEYPRAPVKDPAKEALQQVLDGTLPLRVQADRPDEIRAALALALNKKIPQLVLEQCYGGAALAPELAKAGVPCVLTEVLPGSLPKDYEAFDPVALPAVLQQQGVAFAIASGSARRAGSITLMAAAAVGAGLDAEAALRAITLSPAEILGVQKDAGSLAAGKFADLIVCDRPLLQSDCHILRVLSAGQTQFEAK